MDSTISSIQSSNPEVKLTLEQCAMFGARVAVWIILFIILNSIFSSILSNLMSPPPRYYKTYGNKNYMLEGFKNSGTPLHELEYKKYGGLYSDTKRAKYSSAQLTGLVSTSGAVSNMSTGEIKKYIFQKNGRKQIRIEARGYVYIIGGDVFTEEEPEQKYELQLADKDDNILNLGEMKKDGDGVYKLSFVKTSEKPEEIDRLDKYTKAMIVYYKNGEKQVLLYGSMS